MIKVEVHNSYSKNPNEKEVRIFDESFLNKKMHKENNLHIPDYSAYMVNSNDADIFIDTKKKNEKKGAIIGAVIGTLATCGISISNILKNNSSKLSKLYAFAISSLATCVCGIIGYELAGFITTAKFKQENSSKTLLF